MPEHPVIEDAVAIVPVSDVRKTVDFYVEVFGFEERFFSHDGRFAIVLHGEAAVHFVKAEDADSLKATANHISVYLWVKHVDALYDLLKPKLEALSEGRVRAPFTQDYGMREFHVKDPDGCLLLFGEEASP